MKLTLQSVFRSFTLFIFWLILPPIFLTLSIIWKTPRRIWRIVLTLIAPLTLLVLVMSVNSGSQYYYHHISRGSKNEIETLTGLKLPRYKIIEKRHFTYGPNFQGDFIMEYTIKLDTVKIKEFYNKIEEQITDYNLEKDRNPEPFWVINENGDYYFKSSGIQPETHETLELLFDKKNATMKVEFGTW